MLVDTHCHLTADAFDPDRAAVLERARAAGVGGVIVIASDLEDALRAGAVVAASPSAGPRLFSTAGVHPHQAGEVESDTEARLREFLGRPEVVAVGECGLDFHYDFTPREAQFRWFERQLRLAGDADLPVVVHCREAEEEMIPRVKEAGDAGVRGVLHCFPGDLRLLETALEAGWSVSFTGIVTFRNFQGEEAVRTVPAGRYFLETDGPYLAPVPHRGKRNEPAYLPLIRDRVAKLRTESPEKVEMDSTAAARAFFRLPSF
jgi:TatD DNase family protein